MAKDKKQKQAQNTPKQKSAAGQNKMTGALLPGDNPFRTLVENINDVVYTLSPDGVFTYVSPNWTDLIGHDVSEVIGQPFATFVHPDDLPACVAFLEKVLSTGEKQSGVEYRVKHKEGHWLWHTSNGAAIKDEEGNALYYVGVSRDITERKQIEEALRESERSLAETLEIAQLGNWTYDVQKDLFTFNDQFYKLLHTSAEQEGGYQMSPAQYAEKFIPPEEAVLVAQETQRALDAPDDSYHREISHRIIRADGSEGYFNVHIRIAKDEQGNTVQTYGANQDITEHKRFEQMLARQADETEILYSLSGRLNNATSLEEVLEALASSDVGHGVSTIALSTVETNEAGEPEWATLAAYWSAENRVTSIPVGTRFHIPDFPTAQIWVSNPERAKLIEDVHDDERVSTNLLQIYEQANIASTVDVPLLMGRRWVGTVSLTWTTPQTFTEQHQRLFDALGKQAAVVVNNLLLLQESQQRAAQLEVLTKIASDLSQAIDENEILEAIVTHFEDIPHAELSYFETDEHDKPESAVRTAVWSNGDIQPQTPEPIDLDDFPITQLFIDDPNRVLLISDIEKYAGADEKIRQFALQAGMKAVAFMPLHSGGRWQGGISFTWPEAHEFSVQERFIFPRLRESASAVLASRRAWLTQQKALLEQERLSQEVDRQRSTLEAVLQSMPAGVAVAEAPSGRLILSNEQSQEMLGRGIDPDAGADELAEVYDAYRYGTDELYPTDKMPIVRALSGESVTVDDMEIRKPNGEKQLIEVTGAPIRDSQGDIISSVAIFQDITERHQIEETLAKRASELETVAQISTAVSTILETDKLLREVTNLTKDGFDLYHAHIYLLNEAQDTLVLAAGAGEVGKQMVAEKRSIPIDQEQSLVARAARTREGVIINDVQQDPGFLPHPLLPDTRAEMAIPIIIGDKVLGVLDIQAAEVNRFTEEDVFIETTLASQIAVALENAAQHKQTQTAFSEAQRSRRFLDTLIDNIPNPIFYKDVNGVYLGCNEAFSEYLGKPEDEIVGKTVHDLITDQALANTYHEKDMELLQNPGTQVYESSVVYADGSLRDVIFNKATFTDREGNVAGLVGTMLDITERKQIETRLHEALNIARLANWELDLTKGLFTFTDQFYNLLHTSAEEEGGYQLSVEQYEEKFLPPEATSLIEGEIREALETTDPNYGNEIAHLITFADGEEGYVNTRFRIVKDEQGNTVGAYGTIQDVTEEKEAQEALRQNEALLRSIIDATPDWIFIKDQDHRYRLVNQGYAQDLHLEPEDFIGKNDLELGFPEELVKGDPERGIAGFWADDRRVMESGEPFVIPNDIVTVDDELRTLHTIKVPLRNEDDEVWGLLAFGRDITELKETEKRLQEDEARLAEALNIARLANWELDLTKGLFTFTDQFYNLLHTSAEEEGGYQLSVEQYEEKFLTSEATSLIEGEIQKALETTDPNYGNEIEHPVIFANGEEGYVNTRFRIVKDKQGNTVGAYGTIQDVTEEKEAQEALRQNEALLRSIIDATPDWIFIKDQDHRYRLVNQGYAQDLHLEPEDFIGKNDLELGFPEELVKGDPERGIAGFWADDRRVMESGEPFVIPNDIVTVDDELRTLHTIKVPLRNEDDEVWGLLAFGRDITELKQTEERLQEATEMARLSYWEYEPETQMFHFTDQLYQMLGTNVEQEGDYTMPLDKFVQTYLPPDETSRMVTAIQKGIDAEEENYLHEEESRALTADGQELNILVRFRAVKDQSGKTIRLIGTNQDITERKRARAEQERLASILQATNDLVGSADMEGNIFYINQAGRKMLGLSKDEAPTNRTVTDLTADWATDTVVNEGIPTAIREGTWLGETALIGNNGEEILVSQMIIAHKNPDGSPAFISTIARDITESKEIENRLRENEARLGEALEIANMANWQFDLGTNIFTFNDQFYDILHTSVEEEGSYQMSVEQFTQKFVHPDYIHLIGEEIEKAMATTDPNYISEIEYPLYRADGGTAYVNARIKIILDNKGNTVQAYGTFQDISERKQIEQQLAQQAEELEKVAEISATVATTLETQKLLQDVADLAKSSFNLYHAHIYLLNDAGDTLILTAGAGEVGQQMVTEGRTISMAQEQSLVARAARTHHGVIVNDVHADPGGLPHPLLPDTKAELAVPMIIGNQVLGVLDVQSETIGRFTEQDINIQTTLATQIAAALQNTRYFERAEKALAELNAVTRRLTREGWQSYLDTLATEEIKFVYDAHQAAVTPGQVHESEDPMRRLTQALTIQGEPIGRLSLIEPQSLTADAEDIIGDIAERLSLHIENLRLSEETQGALAEAERLYNVSAQLNAASNLTEILQVIASPEIAPGVTNVTFSEIEVDENGDPEWSIMRAYWHAEEAQDASPIPIGTRFYLPDFPTANLWTAHKGHSVLVGDVQKDKRIDKASEEVFVQSGTLATVMIPLTIGQRWLGVVSASWDKPRRFSEREQRLFDSVAAQAAVAVNNQLLFEQTQDALKLTENLYEASRRLSTAGSDLQEALQAVVEVPSISAIDRASLFVFDYNASGEMEAARVAATWDVGGSVPPAPVGTRFPSELFTAIKMLNSSEPVFYNDIQNDEDVDPASLQMAKQQNIYSAVSIPLKVGQRRIGALLFISEKAHHYSAGEITPYIALAGQLATAIDRQQLFTQLQVRAERERSIRAISDKIRRGANREAILQIAQQEISQLLGASHSTVQLGTQAQLLSRIKRQLAQRGTQQNDPGATEKDNGDS